MRSAWRVYASKLGQADSCGAQLAFGESTLKAVRGLGADFEERLLLVDKLPFRGGSDPSHSKRGFHTRVC